LRIAKRGETSYLKAGASTQKMGINMAKLEIIGTKLPGKVVMEVVLNSLNARLKEVEETIIKLQTALSEFEKKHGLSSDEFLEKWRSNELEDNMDFFEWETCLILLQKLSKEREALKEVLQ
jgi:hypothetical protein